MHTFHFRNVAAALVVTGTALVAAQPSARAQGSQFRPPAVPLVTHDPYFSAWSTRDRLGEDWPRHWTGAIHAMCGMARIDGKPFRFMGAAPQGLPEVLEGKATALFRGGGRSGG